jgi:hypothetical protein
VTDRYEQHDQPSPPAFEIPLTGDGPLSIPIDEGVVPPSNWRKIVGLASLGGVVGGILLSVVLLGFVWNDDDGDNDGGDPPTTIVTTPPTLASLGTIPEPEQDVSTESAGPGAPAREDSLLDQIVVPTYPPVTEGEVVPSDGFDLYAAVAQLDDDITRRSSTRLELGVGGFVRDYTIVRDPTTDRYEVTREGATMIVDGTTGLTFLDWSSPGDEQWLPIDDRLLAESVGIDSVGVFYHRLLIGPIRPATLSSATVTPGDYVLFDDGISTARAFDVEVPGALIPEWQLYVFGPTNEFLPSDRPSRLNYSVYVDGRNQIRRIVGLSDLGGIPQLIVHDLATLAERFPIDLPDPATINTGPPRFPPEP